MSKGQIINGNFSSILIRQKASDELEVGELLVTENKDTKMLLQVTDLFYGSQISQQNLELISGMNIEEGTDLEFMEPELRNYKLAKAKNLITIKGNDAKLSKSLPGFFSEIRAVEKEDLKFLEDKKNNLKLGMLRSGSKGLGIDVSIDAEKMLSHHVLIPATTGRGKSNLTKYLLWNLLDCGLAGILVLDPHDEYFGRSTKGLKEHPLASKKLVYYTPRNAPPGAKTLKINLKSIKPHHFDGAYSWSDPQKEALEAYYRQYDAEWISALLLDNKLTVDFNEATLNVVKRRLLNILNIKIYEENIVCTGVFDNKSGETTVSNIVSELEDAKIVVVDTSILSGPTEILVGSIIANSVLNSYKRHKTEGTIDRKPVISIVIEEAPRVLGKEVLETGPNIFSTIAREGRKFKVGIIAITQLPSAIPRSILANMNTKIILGLEMKPERMAIIESASQDLSDDDRNIASLDKGEAIISSNFVKFALPIKIPFFDDVVDFSKKKTEKKYTQDFSGVGLG